MYISTGSDGQIDRHICTAIDMAHRYTETDRQIQIERQAGRQADKPTYFINYLLKLIYISGPACGRFRRRDPVSARQAGR